MAQEAWRAYLELAMGMTEASTKKATKAVKRLVGKGGATAEQLQVLAEELVKAGSTNREAVVNLIRFELDRALGRVGLATADEVGVLTARVRELEEQIRAASGAALVRAAAAADALSAPVPQPGLPSADSAPGPVGTEPIAVESIAVVPAKQVAKKVATKAVKKALPRVPAEPASLAVPGTGPAEAPAPAAAKPIKATKATKAVKVTKAADSPRAATVRTAPATATIPTRVNAKKPGNVVQPVSNGEQATAFGPSGVTRAAGRRRGASPASGASGGR